MRNPTKLIFHRIKNEWGYHYKVWKTAVDWIVWLYILIPALIAAGYQYYSLWTGQAEWPHHFPLTFSWFIFFVLAIRGTIRLFVREGDVLFLRQYPVWLQGLMKGGIVYSAVTSLLISLTAAVIMLPLWIIYEGTSYWTVGLFLVFAILFRLVFQYIRQMLELRFDGWRLFFASLAATFAALGVFNLFLFTNVYVKGAVFVLVAVGTVVLTRKRLAMTWCFFDDCVREQQQKLRLSALFIGASGYKVQRRFKQRKKPLILFPESEAIYTHRSAPNILGESFIKFMLRNRSKLLIILQMTGVFMLAVVLVPFWVKWVLLPVCIICLNHYTRTGWTDLTAHSFFKLYPFQKNEQTDKGVRKAVAWITLPCCFLVGLMAGWSAYTALIGFGVAGTVVILNYVFLIRELLV